MASNAQPKPVRKITLSYTDARSDKLYSLSIEEDVKAKGRYHVFAYYGRRGGTMQSDTKTRTGSLPLDAAHALFDQVMNEKLAKGYQRTNGATPVQSVQVIAPVGAREAVGQVGGLPGHMLLNPIEEPEMRKLLDDDRWLLQPKFDGVRVRVSKTTGDVGKNRAIVVRALSRTQKPVSLPDDIVRAASNLTRDFVVDGELVGDTLIVFDVLVEGAIHFAHEACEFRVEFLNRMFKNPTAILPSMSALTRRDKHALFEAIHSKGLEGVVFKDKRAPYTAGRPHTGGPALKYKFMNTCSVIVAGQHGNKNSIDVMLHDGRDLGSVTMIGKNIPPAGAVVEVRYLYCHDVGGKLIQPVFLRVREDVAPEDCTADQLRVKGKER
jgi:bifunctional non-homologous end joining protein LigD